METEVEATFSTCFGAPFLPLPATTYAEMLSERLKNHGTRCYLINTGWSGGPYGVGSRIDIAATREMVSAVIGGKLDDAETRKDPFFGLNVPVEVPGVDRRTPRPPRDLGGRRRLRRAGRKARRPLPGELHEVRVAGLRRGEERGAAFFLEGFRLQASGKREPARSRCVHWCCARPGLCRGSRGRSARSVGSVRLLTVACAGALVRSRARPAPGLLAAPYSRVSLGA